MAAILAILGWFVHPVFMATLCGFMFSDGLIHIGETFWGGNGYSPGAVTSGFLTPFVLGALFYLLGQPSTLMMLLGFFAGGVIYGLNWWMDSRQVPGIIQRVSTSARRHTAHHPV